MREIKVLVDDDTKAISITTMALKEGGRARVDVKAFDLPDGVDTISMGYVEDNRIRLEEYLEG